jgi:chromosome segregation ATPase
MLLDAKQSAATLARLSQEHDKYKSECDRLSDQQRSIELAAATHRRDNEHLVRRCADVTHEVTLKDDQLRLLRNALNEAKEAKDQAMTERDAALTRDEAARREVARLDERYYHDFSV